MVIVIDCVGNNGLVMNFFVFDSGLFVVLVIMVIEDDVGSVQGNIVVGGVMDDIMLMLCGIMDIGFIVEVFIDGDLVGFVIVDVSGNWIFEIVMLLSESIYYFIVQVINVNGLGGLFVLVGIIVDFSVLV